MASLERTCVPVLLSARGAALRARPLGPGHSPTGPVTPFSWEPAIDVYETEADLVVIADLAGVTPDDIHLELAENHRTLRLSGRRDRRPLDRLLADGPADRQDAHSSPAPLVCHQLEIRSGSFGRSVILPHTVDADAATARHRDGLLVVRLPKRAASGPVIVRVAGAAGADMVQAGGIDEGGSDA